MSDSVFRVWHHIDKINCPETRIALSKCKSPDIVEKHRTGFPDCFSDRPIKSPISLMMEYGTRFALLDVEIDSDEYPDDILSFRMYAWAVYSTIPRHYNWDDGMDRDIPAVIMRQLVGKELGEHIFVTWKEKKCVVAEGLENVGLGEIVPKDFFPTSLVLIDCELIDFDS